MYNPMNYIPSMIRLWRKAHAITGYRCSHKFKFSQGYLLIDTSWLRSALLLLFFFFFLVSFYTKWAYWNQLFCDNLKLFDGRERSSRADWLNAYAFGCCACVFARLRQMRDTFSLVRIDVISNYYYFRYVLSLRCSVWKCEMQRVITR